MDHSWGYGSEQRLRNENQDCYGVFEFPDFTLAVVCDGMGGHVGGAQASALAVKTIHDSLHQTTAQTIPEALEEALQKANQAIYESARRNHRLMGMGTTVVAAAVTDEVAFLAHVGDSRAYLVRNTQVGQVTRDHTMVNLFVDAELLTPEDAATHPEAHVLSRSLGVERQVDVELSEPLELQPEDVLFLCSDGVHTVLTDWEIGNVDWGAPHEGIRHILDIVIAREGDDNATAVSVLCATSFEDVPPTPVPLIRSPEELETAQPIAGGVTAVPVEEDAGAVGYGDGESVPYDQAPPPSQPAPLQQPSGDAPSYVVFENEKPPAADAPQQAEERPRLERTRKQGRGRRTALLLSTVALLFLCGGGVLVVSSFVGSGSEGAAILADPVDPGIQEAKIQIQVPEGLAPEEDPDATDASKLLFAPELPPPPRRLPHRSMRYNQPPPGGPIQWEAVQAARNHECRRSLDAVIRGMSVSVDHASLFSQAWYCFEETHQRPLADARIENPEDFIFLIPNLEGAPEDRKELLDEKEQGLPGWYQPAVGGIEYRLDAWATSTKEDLLSAVLSDLIGDPTLADHIAKDLLLEALAAVGMSKIEEPNERQTDWWARRVYVVARGMSGPPGRLLETHRPEVVPRIRELLDEATSPREIEGEEGTTTTEVPEVVLQARAVGQGDADPPGATRVHKGPRGPAKPVEPELKDLEDDFQPAKVYKPN